MLRTGLSFLGWLLPASVLAAHPLVSDDTGTQGARGVQLELTAEVARDRPESSTLDEGGAAAATLSLGVAEAADVVLGLPGAWSRRRVGDRVVAEAAGAGDATLDVKWRCFEAGGFSVAVKPGLSLPTGDPRRGLGTGRPGYGLALIASQAVGPVSLHFDGGWRRAEHRLPEDRTTLRHERWHASVAAAAEVGAGLRLVANLGVESAGERGATPWPAFALLGAVWALGDRIDVDAGVRTALNAPGTDLLVLAGAALRF